MWLIICHNNDVASKWLYEALRHTGVDNVEIISAEALPYALKWKHCLNSVSTEVEFNFKDGRTYRLEEIDGIINRISYINPEVWHFSQAGDQDYILQELSAFFSGWLFSLDDRIYNPPHPLCLSGRIRSISEWALLASKVGLQVPIYTNRSEQLLDQKTGWKIPVKDSVTTVSLLVFNDQVFGPIPSLEVNEGCLKLASICCCPLLGLEFSIDTNNVWLFTYANSLPDFRLGGMPFVEELARQMRLTL